MPPHRAPVHPAVGSPVPVPGRPQPGNGEGRAACTGCQAAPAAIDHLCGRCWLDGIDGGSLSASAPLPVEQGRQRWEQ